MPPKTVYTKEQIIEAAIQMLENGCEKLTARNIAKEMGMSVIPIYSHFSSMDELETLLFDILQKRMFSYPIQNPAKRPLFNAGISYVLFAAHKRNSFAWLYRYQETKKADNNGLAHILDQTFEKIKSQDCFEHYSEAELRELITELWIYTHGLASLVNTGLVCNIDEESIKAKLQNIFGYLYKKPAAN